MVNSRQSQWLFLLVCGLSLLKTESFLVVPVTRVEWAKEKGAVCLDGTAPAYALDYGTGDGANKWIIFLEGGGWCNSPADCFSRSNTDMGSSKQWDNRKSSMVGILDNEEKSNPYFHHWNRVYVRYCDGSSYSGDVEQPYKEKDHLVYFRGKRVFDAIIEDLLGKGLKNASHALLAGCSAGGLGAMLRCDGFRSLLPTSTKVKCASDAGFFIDAADVYGGHYFRGWYAQVVDTHGVKYLPESCKAKMNASLCMFPENFVADIQTPLFLINSAFDFWQIQNIKVPNLKDSNPEHQDRYLKFLPCRKDIELCTCDQAKAWRDYEGEFTTALSKLGKSTSYFITACNSHCHTQNEEKWVGEATKIDNVGMAEALSKWIFDDVTFRKKDDIHKTPIVCAYDTGEPNVNNNYTWGGLPINAHFTTKDEIARKSKLVSVCPAEVPCYGASVAAAKQCPAPTV